MEDSTREYIKIASSILVISIVVGFAVLATSLAYSARAQYIQNKDINSNLVEYSEFYEYDDTTVNGSDIVEVILKYQRLYAFRILDDRGNVVHVISNQRERDLGSKIWTQEYIITELLKNDVYREYKSILNVDDYGSIMGIDFKEK